MSFTVSYHWGGHKLGDLARIIRHNAREVDAARGVEACHSNRLIRPEFTGENYSLVNDGCGGFREMESSTEVMEFFAKRLSELQNFRTKPDGSRVPVAFRKDANLAVEFVLQLDPRFTRDRSKSDDYYDNLSSEEYEALPPAVSTMTEEQYDETIKYLEVMTGQVISEMGAENIASISLHLDESNPHVQILAVPEHQGGVSYTKRFGGSGGKAGAQKAYAAAHDRMRKSLQEAGYDCDFSRLAKREHESIHEFKRRRKQERDLRSQAREIETQRDVLSRQQTEQQAAQFRAQQVAQKLRADAEREAASILRSAERRKEQVERAAQLVDEREHELAVREVELDVLSDELSALQTDLRDGLSVVAQDRRTLEKLIAEVRAIPEQQRARCVAALQAFASDARGSERVVKQPIPQRSSISTFLDDDDAHLSLLSEGDSELTAEDLAALDHDLLS